MLVLLSPAKSLDLESEVPNLTTTEPVFIENANKLGAKLKKYKPLGIKKLMGLSDALAQLNYERFQAFSAEGKGNILRPAIFTFKGDVYQGFDVESRDEKSLAFTQEKVRLLSGLYGVLKPFDLMQPYRLEMGTKLNYSSTKNNLYQFWGDAVTKQLNKELDETNSKVLLNLASNEYFKVINPKLLKTPIVKVDFKDFRNGDYKVISFLAKKARGLMTRYIVDNKIDTIEEVKSFNLEGYYYEPSESTDNHIIFKKDK